LLFGPQNTGDTTKATDPYFPFEDAVDVWARCFAALGIAYRDSVMTLDLCDRPTKYSNGFCHWPQVGRLFALVLGLHSRKVPAVTSPCQPP
jgi:hypothetical protein